MSNNKYIALLKIQFYETLKENSRLEKNLTCTAQKLGFTIDEFLKGLLYYDGESGSFANEVYADHGVRGALYLKYFIKDTYHIDRQNILSDYVNKCLQRGARKFVDIGYGAPGLYIEDLLMLDDDVSLTLLDKFPSVRVFTKALLDCSFDDKIVQQKVTLGDYNYDTMVNPGFFDAYIMFDSIEHAKNPTNSLRLITENASQGAYFLLSIPIGKKIR